MIIYLLIGVVFVVWTHLIAGEYPEDLHGGEIAICAVALFLLRPVFLPIVVSETRAVFR